MNNSNSTNELLEAIGQVLIRCFAMGMVILLFWAGSLALMGDLTYNVHTAFISISRQQFDIIHYSGLLITKMVIFVLFLLPYIAIRLVIKKQED